ncbi:MAG TPA: SMC family ATPase, partial [Chloroflexota bacterium]|nr:SMC family ATPase [Chloroflexota bacterium]
LRFDGIHVAVLTGDNGHGKSALLDAITWALWGRARGRSVDELIHAGASEMEVEFEFILDDQQYRVIRKRQRRGKYGTTLLDFFVLSPDGYRPLTERSQAETERLIERTLRMTYETFTSSSFIQQGRADNFTTSSPAERKRILAEILELGCYDELEARAKERFKSCEARLADERRLATEWELEIARRPEYQAELDRLRAELTTLERRAAALEADCLVLRERVAGLQAIQHQVDEGQARLERMAAERQRLTTALQERRALHGQATIVIGRAADIERAAAELDSVSRDLEVLVEQQQQCVPLERAREIVLRTLAAEQARLEADVEQREGRLVEVRQVAQRLSAIQVELRRAQQEASTLAQLEQQHDDLLRRIGVTREDAAEKRTLNAQLKKEMLELRQRLDSLEDLATCPTCQRPMDAAHKRRLRDELSESGTKLRDEFRAQEAVCRELEGRVVRDEAELAALGQQLAGRDAVHRRVVEGEGQLQLAAEAQRQGTLLQVELAAQRQLLRENSFAPDARLRLGDIEQRLRAVGYDEARHHVLRKRGAELASAARERELLEQARLAADHLATQIADLSTSLQRLEGECAAERARLERLAVDVGGLPAERARLADLDAQLTEARRSRDETRDLCLFAQSRLDNCAFLERKQKDSLARQDALRREQSVFGDLVYAFG